MPYGFSGDEVHEFLGVSSSKATQAINEAWDKIAKAHLYDRNRAERTLLDRIEWWIRYYETPASRPIACERVIPKRPKGERRPTDEMTPEELERRKAIVRGQWNSTSVDGNSERASDIASGRAVHPLDERR